MCNKRKWDKLEEIKLKRTWSIFFEVHPVGYIPANVLIWENVGLFTMWCFFRTSTKLLHQLLLFTRILHNYTFFFSLLQSVSHCNIQSSLKRDIETMHQSPLFITKLQLLPASKIITFGLPNRNRGTYFYNETTPTFEKVQSKLFRRPE